MQERWAFALSFALVCACGGDSNDSAGDVSGDSSSETGGETTDSTSTSASDSGTTGSETGSESGSTGSVAPAECDPSIEWTPCPLHTGGQGSEAECATVQVASNWNDADSDPLELFVKRIGNPDGDTQLWMLMGGPGGASAGYESEAELYTGADPEMVVYLLDHRGTGRSSRLGCSVQEDINSPEGRKVTTEEWPDCIASVTTEWGETLDFFTTTNAAKDLGCLIERTRGEDQAVHLFGGSYGTYWAQRYLQIFPDQASGVTLLGIAPPLFTFTKFDTDYDAVGQSFMDACSVDPFCSSKLGNDAVAKMREIMDAADAGHCPQAQAAGLDRETLKVYFGSRLSWSWSERALIPAILYRFDRCNAQDIAALQNAAPQMQNPLAGLLDDPLFSQVVNLHISLSEMWEPPIPTIEEAEMIADEALFGLGSLKRRIELADMWPVYPLDEYEDGYAETDTPMLMMTGEYDPNSPLEGALVLADVYTAPNQTFVTLPRTQHGWGTPTTEGYSCAQNMFYNFMQDPEAPLLDCLDLVLPIDFQGTQQMAQALFGTADLYE